MMLREATIMDWEILLEWRNDPTTRKNSFTQESISESSHKTWLTNSLLNPDRKIYILEYDSTSIGTIRSDKTSENIYILSWNISPNQRGKGYGVKILELFLKNKTGKFIAEIKPENIASIKIVEKNGFSKITNTKYVKQQ